MIYYCKSCLYSTNKSSNLNKHNKTKKHLCRVEFEQQQNIDVCSFVDTINPKPVTKTKIIETEKKPKKKKVKNTLTLSSFLTFSNKSCSLAIDFP